MRTSNLHGFLLLAALLGAGCGSTPLRVDAERTLPFSVRLLQVRIDEESGVEEAVTPADFGHPDELTRDLAEALEAARVFSRVSDDPEVPADLEIEVRLRDLDFGEGTPTVAGAIISTITWIGGGHLSWFIDNRAYPDSRVTMSVKIYEADAPPLEGKARTPLFEHDLFPTGLSTNFMERTRAPGWFLNILLPPWVGEGDPEEAGRSLASRSARFFAEQETDRFLRVLPQRYYDAKGCYFAYDAETTDLVLVARVPLHRLDIGGRTLSNEILADRRADGEETQDSLRRRFRVSGLNIDTSKKHYYYRIPLGPDDGDTLRLEAVLKNGERVQGTVLRFAAPGA